MTFPGYRGNIPSVFSPQHSLSCAIRQRFSVAFAWNGSQLASAARDDLRRYPKKAIRLEPLPLALPVGSRASQCTPLNRTMTQATPRGLPVHNQGNIGIHFPVCSTRDPRAVRSYWSSLVEPRQANVYAMLSIHSGSVGIL